MRMSFSWCDLGIGVVSANVSVCFFWGWGGVLCDIYRAAPPTNYIYRPLIYSRVGRVL